MLPDSKLGTDGFHDVLIDNLAASPAWRLSHISPADVTALRRRWPKAVFRTMQRRAKEVEHLRRGAHHRSDRAFQHSVPGFCHICEVKIEIGIGHAYGQFPSGAGSVVALPGRMVHGLEGLRP